MATKKQDDRKVAAFLAKAQRRNDRDYAARVARLKRAFAGAKFYDWELTEIERMVFSAYGATALGGRRQ